MKPVDQMTWKDLNIGCVITEPGNAAEYKSGDWRSMRPIWDKDRCIQCGVCYIFCPDAAIYKTEDNYFEADLYYCKGCGICVKECVTGAIRLVEEEE